MSSKFCCCFNLPIRKRIVIVGGFDIFFGLVGIILSSLVLGLGLPPTSDTEGSSSNGNAPSNSFPLPRRLERTTTTGFKDSDSDLINEGFNFQSDSALAWKWLYFLASLFLVLSSFQVIFGFILFVFGNITNKTDPIVLKPWIVFKIVTLISSEIFFIISLVLIHLIKKKESYLSRPFQSVIIGVSELYLFLHLFLLWNIYILYKDLLPSFTSD